ncbi:MAG TPA: hypothetical protein VHC70_06705 [Phycisphaerales bacterium]|nr:hypothetical protein [Phycisphaerales bacterium]
MDLLTVLLRRSLVVLLAVMAWAAATPLAAGADDFDELAPKIRALVPSEGTIEAVYVAKDPGAIGEELVGFDLGHGAWYLVSSLSAMGLDPAGRYFAGPPQRLPDVRFITDGTTIDQDEIDQYCAQPMLWDILNKGRKAYTVHKDPSGGYTVTTTGPRGRRTLDIESIAKDFRSQFPPGLWEVTLDENAVPVRLHRSWSGQEDSIDFHWSKRPKSPWLLNEQTPQLRLGSFTAGNDPSRFERASVASSGLDSVTRIEEAKAFLVQQSLASRGRSAGQAGAATGPAAPGVLRSGWRWAVIGGSVLACVGVAGWALRLIRGARGKSGGSVAR